MPPRRFGASAWMRLAAGVGGRESGGLGESVRAARARTGVFDGVPGELRVGG